MIVAVVGTKGGVGKTTTAMHVAAQLTRAGARVLLVDTDPQASAQSWAEQADGLPFGVVGVLGQVARQVRQMAADYDHVVIDTPPGRGDRGLSRGALLVADLALLPLAPSLIEADKLGETLELLGEASEGNPELRVRVLLTRVRAGTRMAGLAPEMLAGQDLPVCDTVVPLREQYALAYGTDMAGSLGAYEPLAAELLDAVKVTQ